MGRSVDYGVVVILKGYSRLRESISMLEKHDARNDSIGPMT